VPESGSANWARQAEDNDHTRFKGQGSNDMGGFQTFAAATKILPLGRGSDVKN